MYFTHIFLLHYSVLCVMATIPSNAIKNQLRMFLVVVVIIVSSVLLVTYMINPIGRISQLQYVFAQKNTTLSIYKGTSTNKITYPLIHNYASSPPAPVNSWIIESKNGLVVVDTQRQFSEAKKLLKEVEDINKPILGVIFTHPHPDHINGAAALLNGTANVPIYSTQSAFNVMKNDIGGYIALSKQLLPHNEYSKQVVLPNRIVRSGENITIDGITYRFEDLGIGEAEDMMAIYLPSQKMMFTGDIVNNHMHPFFAGAVSPQSPSHILEWVKQIKYI
jgi:glyoxylase-like metal-dependent hydrolase (beta-lactamase superfamily II)